MDFQRRLNIVENWRDYFQTSFLKQIGTIIRQAREDAGITQAQLAQLLERRQASLSAIENGKMEPDASTIAKLAVYLRMPPQEFFPHMVQERVKLPDLAVDEFEILKEYARLRSKRYKDIVLAQIRLLADYEDREDFEELEQLKADPNAWVPDTVAREEWLHHERAMRELRAATLERLLGKENSDEEDTNID